MKRTLIFILSAAMLLTLLCGCAGAETTMDTASPLPTATPTAEPTPDAMPTASPLPISPVETAVPVATPIPTEENPTAANDDAASQYLEAYRPILDGYYDMLSGPIDGQALMNSDFCFLCLYCLDPLSDVGYALYDLDMDGSMELFIVTLSQEEYLRNVVFDMYYLDEGQPRLVFQSQERQRFYVDYIGEVVSDWANSASESGLTAMSYQGGQLTEKSTIMDPLSYKEFETVLFSAYK